MNAQTMTRKIVAFAASASVDAPARPRLPVKSNPGRKTPTPEEHVADMLRRFPKTMAYLAEH
jgi:hypothetical protein